MEWPRRTIRSLTITYREFARSGQGAWARVINPEEMTAAGHRVAVEHWSRPSRWPSRWRVVPWGSEPVPSAPAVPAARLDRWAVTPRHEARQRIAAPSAPQRDSSDR